MVKNQVENYAVMTFVPEPLAPLVRRWLKARRARRVQELADGLQPRFLTKKEIFGLAAISVPLVQYIIKENITAGARKEQERENARQQPMKKKRTQEEEYHSESDREETAARDKLVQRIKKSPFGLRGSPAALTKKSSFYATANKDKPLAFRVGDKPKFKNGSKKLPRPKTGSGQNIRKEEPMIVEESIRTVVVDQSEDFPQFDQPSVVHRHQEEVRVPSPKNFSKPPIPTAPKPPMKPKVTKATKATSKKGKKEKREKKPGVVGKLKVKLFRKSKSHSDADKMTI
jgi:hypothetical protein